MFDKNKFAQIIKNIKETYSSQEEFAEKSGIGRTYLSQYMNMRLDTPPKPKILERLATSSNGITDYSELMEVCGYINDNYFIKLQYLKDKYQAIEKHYINKLVEYELSSDEAQIYDDLLNIINTNKLANFSNARLDNELDSYFNNMDYINKVSKKKIINKIKLFIECYKETKKARNDLLAFEHNHTENSKLNTSNSNISKKKQYYMIPVYGQISAGQPNWAEENLEGYLPIDPDLMNIINPEEYFFLRVNGESMNNIVKNGAFALIHKQDIVENGEIAVVLVNGYDATLKKFTKQGNLVILEPNSTDESFKTQVYDKTTSIKILGKYVGKLEING